MFFGGGDPFSHAHFGGGGRRGGGADPRAADTTKLYETLGLKKTCTPKDIKTAYRKLAMTNHPDKGGDEHKFKEINAAYEILSDPDKRAKYDKFGLEGVADDDDGRRGGGGAEDLFSMFFGGGQRRSREPTRGDDVSHPIDVSLQDLYNGKTIKLAVTRQVMVGEPRMCRQCDGQGIVVELRQIGLGMVQQIQRSCASCNGEGYMYKKKSERKILEVLVEKGMKHNSKIVFQNMADEKPNMEAGHVNFIIQEKEHDLFKRKGADLLVTKKLSLKEALCGFSWKIEHLDGRQVVIQSRPGEVIRAQTQDGRPFVKKVPNEGMPSRGNPFVKGNLYILFTVEFPGDNELTPDDIEGLKDFLPGPDTMDEDYSKQEDVEIVHLDHADVRTFGKGGLQNHETAYESDDDDKGGQPQPVNCQQS
ncbi:hypothetical protein MPSEU_000936800 [Mayamaea pseudoterrestris]|nr:hypothetical protein MPSEU_000936800 [Mayamaea pseudoterrestris]